MPCPAGPSFVIFDPPDQKFELRSTTDEVSYASARMVTGNAIGDQFARQAAQVLGCISCALAAMGFRAALAAQISLKTGLGLAQIMQPPGIASPKCCVKTAGVRTRMRTNLFQVFTQRLPIGLILPVGRVGVKGGVGKVCYMVISSKRYSL